MAARSWYPFRVVAGADAAAVDAKGNTPVGLMGKDERPPAGEAAVGEDDEEDDEEDEYEDEEE